ncbi:MAG TPA: hypothetical protein V6D17_03620 [Candidatus Obscuribacterales bacterium]
MAQKSNTTFLVTAFLFLFSGSGMFAQQPSKQQQARSAQKNLSALRQQKLEEVLRAQNLHFSNEIPVNFPVPPYTSNIVKTAFFNSTKGKPAAALTIITKDSPDIVFQWYQGTLKKGDWRVQIPTDKAMSMLGKQGQLYMIDAQKDKHQLNIFLVKDTKAPGTTINISWTKSM